MPTEGVPIASQRKSEGGAQTASCWYKKMSGGATAAILLNTGANAATITCSLSDLMVTGKPKSVRDLWKKEAVPVPADGKLSAKLESHDHMFVLVK